LLDKERGTVYKDPGGKVNVCLVYPNTYYLGMSNLGFQTLYRLVNSLDWAVCERAFLPDKPDIKEYKRTDSLLFSLESQRPLSAFDIVAFSVSFEQDYLNIPVILDLSGFSSFSSERDRMNPLVMAGGCAVSLNPEPVADFIDLFLIGEAEGVVERMLEVYRSIVRSGARKEGFLEGLASIEGVYVPGFYELGFEGAVVKSISPRSGSPEKVKRVKAEGFEVPETCILTPETEFAGTHLVEIERGCGRACRFCAAGFLYLPPRLHTTEAVKKHVARGMETAGKVGLVGAAVSEYPGLKELLKTCVDGEMTLSSLRLDTLDSEVLGLLKGCGYSTITLAPEAATERMRRVVNKDIKDTELMETIKLVSEAGFKKVKLYFMVGLPTETDSDAGAIGDLAASIKSVLDRAGRAGRAGRGNRPSSVTLSINPFVPKPWTPFQWHPFERDEVIERRYAIIKDKTKKIPGIKIKTLSARVASMEAYLSRGDRRYARFIDKASKAGWKKALKSTMQAVVPPGEALYRQRAKDETFPWDVIDHGIDKDYLWKEYQRGLSARVTPPCDVGLCTRCGVCYIDTSTGP
jgi:radical SAM superfamily enzyme YgiQ (UPF0313 family)